MHWWAHTCAAKAYTYVWMERATSIVALGRKGFDIKKKNYEMHPFPISEQYTGIWMLNIWIWWLIKSFTKSLIYSFIYKKENFSNKEKPYYST